MPGNEKNLIFRTLKNKQMGENCTYSRPKFSNLSNAIVKIVVLLILFEYKARELNQVWYALNAFFFKLWLTTIFAQQIRIDKMHHQKARKISYLEVYLVILGQFI